MFTASRADTHEPTDGAPYALKRLVREMRHRDDMRALFARECALTMQLDHPNVVRAVASESVEEQPYLAMEYIPGVSVEALGDEAGGARLSPAAIVAIGIQVCAALGYLATARDRDGALLGVVHRDLAPRNILCSFRGAVKLIDFSAAWCQLRDGSDTAVRGTYAYMSPEQVRGQSLDGRSDLFSLATVLWELCAGRRLFRRRAHYLTLAAVVEQPAPPLTDLDGGPTDARSDSGREVVAALDAVLARALAKNRDDRFTDAEAMAAALVELAERFAWDVGVEALGTELSARILAARPAP